MSAPPDAVPPSSATLWERLSAWFGLTEAGPLPDPDLGASPASLAPIRHHAIGSGGVPDASPAHAPVVAQPATSGRLNTRYTPLLQAIDQGLHTFMEQDVRPHRDFAPHEVFQLRGVELQSTDPQGHALLQAFFQEFRPSTLRKGLLDAVRRQCSVGVSTAHFEELTCRLAPPPAATAPVPAAAPADPWDAALADIQGTATAPGLSPHDRPAATGLFQISLRGEWIEAIDTMEATAPLPTASPREHSPRPQPLLTLFLDIQDAQGHRTLTCATTTFLLGKSGHIPPDTAAAAGIDGTFVSRQHGHLEQDAQGQVFYRDHSTNGTWLHDTRIGHEPVPLRSGDTLVLGRAQGPVADGPRVVVTWQPPVPPDPQEQATPLCAVPENGSTATPLAGTVGMADPATAPVLCQLRIEDTLGVHTVPVTALPFTVGREAPQTQGYRTPAEHAGVSRTHVVLEALQAEGVQVRNHALSRDQRWGTNCDDAEQAAEFTWRWHSTLTLAPRYRAAAPVKLTLLPPT